MKMTDLLDKNTRGKKEDQPLPPFPWPCIMKKELLENSRAEDRD